MTLEGKDRLRSMRSITEDLEKFEISVVPATFKLTSFEEMDEFTQLSLRLQIALGKLTGKILTER